MRYRVGLTQMIAEGATVYVEAASVQEAERVALERANAGKVDWEFIEASEPVEIVSVDQEAAP